MYVILSGTICGNFVFTEQLNHAARHRNVYYDMVGGDPYGEKDYCYLIHYLYSFVNCSLPHLCFVSLCDKKSLTLLIIGHSSPVLTRSHIAVPHKKRRSVPQAELVSAREYTNKMYNTIEPKKASLVSTLSYRVKVVDEIIMFDHSIESY